VPAERDDPSGSDRLTESWVELMVRFGVLALLLYWSFTLVRPFITIAIWSVVLTVALYPVYEWMVRRLGGRRRLAAALLTLVSILIVIGPATWLVLGLIDSLRTLSERIDLTALTPPPPPIAVKSWPLIGEPIYQYWDLASTNLREALTRIVPQLKPLGSTLLGIAAEAGIGAIKFFVAIVIAGFLYAPAPELVDAVRRFVRRLTSERSEEFIHLAGAHHPRGVARRNRDFSAASVSRRPRRDSGRYPRRRADRIRRPHSRHHPDRAVDRDHPVDPLELVCFGYHDGSAVHRLHDPDQLVGQRAAAAGDGSRPRDADADHPARRDWRYPCLWHHRAVPRTYRAGGALGASQDLDPKKRRCLIIASYPRITGPRNARADDFGRSRRSRRRRKGP
jgi:AI-2E family transporter